MDPIGLWQEYVHYSLTSILSSLSYIANIEGCLLRAQDKGLNDICVPRVYERPEFCCVQRNLPPALTNVSDYDSTMGPWRCIAQHTEDTDEEFLWLILNAHIGESVV